jgi:hypothetical protein
LDRLESERTPYANVYPDNNGVPQFWKKYVRDELGTRGASHNQKQGYEWKGKRDDIVESVRARVRSIIAERLKK